MSPGASSPCNTISIALPVECAIQNLKEALAHYCGGHHELIVRLMTYIVNMKVYTLKAARLHATCTRMGFMAYPQQLLVPMREDLTRYGVEETRTPADVDRVLAPENGTVLMVVNSVCGCAAGKARPGIGMALQHAVRPDKAATVFAGGDDAAVAHLRGILSDYPPSSPSIALFQNGKPVYMMHRSDIEPRDAFSDREAEVTEAFDRFCARKEVSVG